MSDTLEDAIANLMADVAVKIKGRDVPDGRTIALIADVMTYADEYPLPRKD